MADRLRNVEEMYATVRKSPPQISDITWDDKPRTLKDLIVLCRDRMPFVAKIQKGAITNYVPGWRSDSSDSRSDSDDELENILHVLEVKCRKIISIRRMQWNRQQAEYLPSDKEIQLPLTYKGWFEVLPDDGRAVEYFDSIQAIANVKPKKFLVRTSIVGYHLCTENGSSSWQPLEIKSGDVLTTGIVYMDQKKGKSTMKTFFKRMLKSNKNVKKDQDLKYLQCFDDEEREIMVPLIMTGLFSPVGDALCCNYDAVYELYDLVMAFKLPVKAQLIQDIEQENQSILPHGMIILEKVSDEEIATVAKFASNGERVQTYEIPINADIRLVKGMTKNKKSHRQRQDLADLDISSPNGELYQDPMYMNFTRDPMLPTRVKENKKSKGGGILDKLSVKSRSKKERASLKALQAEGVFSSRLSKSDMNLEDFFQMKNDENEDEDKVQSNQKSSAIKDNFVSHFDSIDKPGPNQSEYGVMRQYPVQNRDLPPVPNCTSSPKVSRHHDAVYEELPPAPRPPSPTYRHGQCGSTADEEDGYMCPAQVKRNRIRDENPYGTTNMIRTKPPVAPKENAKMIRARKTRSEMPGNVLEYDPYTNSSGLSNINDQNGNQAYSSPYRAIALAQNKRKGSLDDRIFNDDQGLETRSASDWNRVKSRSHKNLNFPANATVRSHNSRRIRNVMDVFSMNDSINDLRQSKETLTQLPVNVVDDYNENVGLKESRSFPVEYARSSSYSVPDQELRRYPRAMSNSGFSDIYRGNDSAISGDYGFHGDSEFSYSEYSEYIDDGWLPPNNLGGLSVAEVSKCMRYIGMKDRVVIRLANEQIDGELLCSLDKKLLKEGFPELNSLEIKKIVDFIHGWRPKKK